MSPRILDLFCGAGGAAMGYQRAGFYVVGVDVAEQPRYCGDVFWHDDALAVAEQVVELGIGGFDAIHASPPCQAYSPLNAFNRKDYPDLVARTRELLKQTGLPYVIENVPQAPLEGPVMLCGLSFGLRLYRHRHFECSFPIMVPPHSRHDAECVRNGYIPGDDQFMSIHGGRHSKEWRRKAARVMGVPWMRTITEVCEAIPPAYTEHIGSYLLAHLNAEVAP